MEKESENEENQTFGCLKLNNKIYPIYQGHNTIGRHPDAIVNIKNLTVSKQHAVITVFDEEKHFLSDFKSTSGTILNNKKLKPLLLYQLENGASIRLGQIHCTYKKFEASNTFRKSAEDTQNFSESFYVQATQEVQIANIPDELNFDELPTQIENFSQINESSNESIDFMTMQKTTDTQALQETNSDKLSQKICPVNINPRKILDSETEDDLTPVIKPKSVINESDSSDEDAIGDPQSKSKYHISDDSETDIEIDRKTPEEKKKLEEHIEVIESPVLSTSATKISKEVLPQDHLYCQSFSNTQNEFQKELETDETQELNGDFLHPTQPLNEKSDEIYLAATQTLDILPEKTTKDDDFLPPTQALEALHGDEGNDPESIHIEKDTFFDETQSLEKLLSSPSTSNKSVFVAPSPLKDRLSLKKLNTSKDDEDEDILQPTQALQILHEDTTPFSKVQEELQELFASQASFCTQQLHDVLENSKDEIIEDSLIQQRSLILRKGETLTDELVKNILAEDIEENDDVEKTKENQSNEKEVNENNLTKNSRRLRSSLLPLEGQNSENSILNDKIVKKGRKAKDVEIEEKKKNESQSSDTSDRVLKTRNTKKSDSQNSDEKHETNKTVLQNSDDKTTRRGNRNKKSESETIEKNDERDETIRSESQKSNSSDKSKARNTRSKSESQSSDNNDKISRTSNRNKKTESQTNDEKNEIEMNKNDKTQDKNKSESQNSDSSKKTPKTRNSNKKSQSQASDEKNEIEMNKNDHKEKSKCESQNSDSSKTVSKTRNSNKKTEEKNEIELNKNDDREEKSKSESQISDNSVKISRTRNKNKTESQSSNEKNDEREEKNKKSQNSDNENISRTRNRNKKSESQTSDEKNKTKLQNSDSNEKISNIRNRNKKSESETDFEVNKNDEREEKNKSDKSKIRNAESKSKSQNSETIVRTSNRNKKTSDEKNEIEEKTKSDSQNSDTSEKLVRTRTRNKKSESETSDDKTERERKTKKESETSETSNKSTKDSVDKNDSQTSASISSNKSNNSKIKIEVQTSVTRSSKRKKNNEEEINESSLSSALTNESVPLKKRGRPKKLEEVDEVESNLDATETRKSARNKVQETSATNKRKNEDLESHTPTKKKATLKTATPQKQIKLGSSDSEDEFEETPPKKAKLEESTVRKSPRKNETILFKKDEITTSTPFIEPNSKQRRLSANSRREKREDQEKTTNNTTLITPERSRRIVKPKVVFTMMDNPELESLIRQLGGSVVDTVDACTVLVTESVKRSQKLLCAVGQGKPICSPKWLLACKKAFSFVDPWDHLLVDREAEKKWNFSLSESLQRSQQNKILKDYSFQIIVNNAADVLKGAIEACGGKCVTRNLPKTDSKHLVIVSTENNKSKYSKIVKQNPEIKVVEPEAIFDGTLRQEFKFDQFLLS